MDEDETLAAANESEPPVVAPEEEEDETEEQPRRRPPLSRNRELSTLKHVREAMLEVFKLVDKGFQDETDRCNEILENWDLYNGKLGFKQTYNGNAQIFVPIIEAAVDARVTRFTNQLFPESGRTVEVLTHDGKYPQAEMALLEHYIRRSKLKDDVIPPMLLNGDVEGQYSLMPKWTEIKRSITHKAKRDVEVDGVPLEDETYDEMVYEELVDAYPDFDVISDCDILILPAQAKNVEEALARGGSVTIRMKLTKGDIAEKIEEGDFVASLGEQLKAEMTKMERYGKRSVAKRNALDAGIKIEGGSSVAEVYQTWAKIEVLGEKRLVRGYYAGGDIILGIKRCPYWIDRVPLISTAQKKKAGLAKGKSPVSSVADIQIYANDAINEAADTAHFSAMPIIMSNPEKNPGPMVLGLAAIWRVDPNNTKVLEFPQLWRYGFEIVAKCQEQIFQKLGVNPSMLPQQVSAPGKKQNQAEVAQQQQVDLLTTAQAVSRPESVLNEALEWMLWLDHQFRDDDMLVQSFGEMGIRAEMETIPPLQMNTRYVFRWNGVEAAKNAAKLQQQISGLNVLRGVQPNMIPGYRVNLAPIIVTLVLGLYGARLAPLILEDLSKTRALDPELENKLLEAGHPVDVNPNDDDPKHIKAHLEALQEGDPHGTILAHIRNHQQQMMAKNMAQMQAAGGGQGQGQPQIAGPQPGGQAEPPRPMRGPPGMIGPEAMAGAGGAPPAPRKVG